MCLFPWKATPQETGRPKPDKEGTLVLPCGKCDECLKLRASAWANRAQHELHTRNGVGCFLTLTYDDDSQPNKLEFDKSHFQSFISLLRHSTHKKFSYIASHEYGSKTGRPHHHVLIFGYEPKKYELIRKSKKGNSLYISDEIAQLWTHGHHSIGEANSKTAYYIASYGLKQRNHTILLPDGEIITAKDSMTASKRPAIGKVYFEKHYKTILQQDTPLPSYYRKLLERIDPDAFEDFQNKQTALHLSRGVQNRLAKYKITTQKRHLGNDTELRHERDTNNLQDYENYLKKEIKLFKEIEK